LSPQVSIPDTCLNFALGHCIKPFLRHDDDEPLKVLGMADAHYLEFLRSKDPGKSLFVIRLRLQDVENEIGRQDTLAFMDPNRAAGERRIRARLSDLYFAAFLVRSKQMSAMSRNEIEGSFQRDYSKELADEDGVGTRAVLDRVTTLIDRREEAYFSLGQLQTTTHKYNIYTRPPQVIQVHCIICDNLFQKHDIATLTCGHHFCRTCLVYLFQYSLIDESLFPPKCCRPIRPDMFSDFLNPELIRKHFEKEEELATIDRTYCSNPRCNKFISPTSMDYGGSKLFDTVKNIGVCNACWKSTCIICKAAAHGTSPCYRDVATEEVLKYAEGKGWKRCPSCHALISLTSGCNSAR